MPAPITAFNDFMKATGPAYLTDAESVINDATRRCYALGQLLRGKDKGRTVQAGTKIKDTIILSVTSTYRSVLPGEPVQFSMRNSATEHEIPWRYGFDYMTWLDQEIEHNSGPELTKEAVKTRYKNLKHIKEEALWTSMFEGLENQLFAPTYGAYATMEGAGGTDPLSIFAIISEAANGLPCGWSSGNTIAGIDPVLNPAWAPPVVFYDPQKPCNKETIATSATERQKSSPTTIAGSSYNSGNPYYPGSATAVNTIYNLRAAFAKMFLQLKFKSPSPGQKFGEESTLRNQMIFASQAGVVQYQDLLYSSNATLRNASDPAYHSPEYAGIPVQYVSAYDNAAAYAAHSSAVTQTVSGAGGITATSSGKAEDHPYTILQGPRYHFVDADYIVPVIHARKFMKRQDPRLQNNTLGSWAQPVECWWGLFPRSRRRVGSIVPHPSA